MTPAVLRPSNAHRWTRCAASPSFESRVPVEPDSDAAREGTCAAWVADCVLKDGLADASAMRDKTHENGWLVTPEMVFYVQKYIDLIRSFGGVTTTEKFVRLNELIAGTLDASTALDALQSLRVTDLKYGYKIVHAFENPQLIIYGAAEALRLINSGQAVRSIVLGIFQPRAWHPDGIYRPWTMDVEELFNRAQWIINRGYETQAPDPVATPGPHCEYCPARGSCVALAHTVYADYAVIESTRQGHLTADELARELDFLDEAEKRLAARRSAIMTEGETRIRQGENIRGWHLKQRLGNRKFVVDAATIEALTGKSPLKPVLMTPAEFEREGASPDMIKHLSRRPNIGHVLDRLPANYLQKVFTT